VVGDEAVSALDRPGQPGGQARERRSTRQQSQQWLERGARGADLAAGLDQVPGAHPLFRPHPGQEPVRLGVLEGDRAEAATPVPGEHLGE